MSRPLRIVLGPHGQVADLRSGAVTIDGVDLDFVTVKRMPDAYRDMARTQPYDISEMAPTTYLMALEAGAPLTAFPIPMTRRFRHKGVLRRKDGSVSGPKGLEGRRVGVRAYAVTAAVWTRGILAEEFGVDPGKVTWLVQEADNVESFAPPANVRAIPDGQSMAALMEAGGIDAAFEGLAGIGGADSDDLVELIDDAAAREAEWFERTGIYPLHGVIAVRNDVIRDHPDIGRRLFDAFGEAKRNYWSRVESGQSAEKEDARYRKLARLVGDPLPYGLDENRATFEALVRYAHGQKLVAKAPRIEALFPDPRTTPAGTIAKWS
jgi:4,5-dihydroxyphthalate decarboxylase